MKGSASANGLLYHGGKAGLRRGDLLVPSPPHVEDGCPICVARSEGRTLTVGEYRAWLRTQGPKARRVFEALGDAPDFAPIDPPSAIHGVYVTSDKQYALFYGSRSGGDLYRVEPQGETTPSREDHFPTWVCASARVVAVIRRPARLTPRERRDLMARWKVADELVELGHSRAGLPL